MDMDSFLFILFMLILQLLLELIGHYEPSSYKLQEKQVDLDLFLID